MNKRIMILLSILERGKGKSFIEMMKKRGITFHIQTVGHGTAPSEMMDLFGLASSDKDVVISLAPKLFADALAGELDKGPDSAQKYKGLTMVLESSAINRLTSAVLTRNMPEENNEKGALETMSKSDNKYELILMSVNQGYSDSVMQCAKGAGATGGTIIKGRLAAAGEFEQFSDIEMSEEKEIIAILAPKSISLNIMNSVNKGFGLSTEAGGILCSVAVESAFKV